MALKLKTVPDCRKPARVAAPVPGPGRHSPTGRGTTEAGRAGTTEGSGGGEAARETEGETPRHEGESDRGDSEDRGRLPVQSHLVSSHVLQS